ncbi:glycosyltransferase [Treponema sp. OMZ 855]|nr:glycosyltransferase [Treponema sp. OMZ 855]
MFLSVLMSVYYKEKTQYLDECMKSLSMQTRPAEEIVCVKDGSLTPELDAILEKWKERLPLKIIGYEQNKGLAYALNFGLQHCAGELIARMDSDDIACTDRFYRQMIFMGKNPNVVLSSGYVKEFYDDPNENGRIKKVPTGYTNIRRYAHFRNPFNHMAVCFRKKIVIGLQGYADIHFFEDYDLWIRILQHGYAVDNIPEVLVYARIGNDMIGRRHGLYYARDELLFLKKHLNSGFFSKCEYLKLLVVRVFPRVLPKKIFTYIYKILRK